MHGRDMNETVYVKPSIILPRETCLIVLKQSYLSSGNTYHYIITRRIFQLGLRQRQHGFDFALGEQSRSAWC